MNPRLVALAVLAQVEATPRRLEALLEEELARHPRADPRDRAFTANLVYGVLRQRSWLDHLLNAFLKRPLPKLEPEVLALLRLGACEIVCLRTPDHAAVHAAVELAKARKLFRAQGLVNASLRALARGWASVAAPEAQADPAGHLAVVYSHPRWLVDELLDRWGWEETRAWLAADQEQPRTALRANTPRIDRAGLRVLLAPLGLEMADHPLSPESLVLAGWSGRGSAPPGQDEGLWQRQDPGATALTHLLGVAPGQRVLDLCAGAGGKTGHLAALMAGQGELIAVEPSPGRLRALGGNLARLGVSCARPVQADGRALPAGLDPFDRILLDAPCTGLGVLGRRPDLRWRRGPADPARLAGLQLELALAAADLLAPGGALLYATCTVTRAENEAVVEALLAGRPELRLEWDLQAAGPAAGAIGPDGYFRTMPHRHACDAFFAARLVRAPQQGDLKP